MPRLRPLLVLPTVLAALLTPGAAQAHRPDPGGRCGPDAALLGFSDALDKTTFDGTALSGLSALALTGHRSALALVDNLGSTPARFYELRLTGATPAVRAMTTLRRPDGTAYTGADFDGEGLVAERGGRTVLASSETEPSIRRFRRSDGVQVAQFEVPPRFRVAPDGEASRNATFEALAASPDGRSLYAGMEGPLSADGTDTAGRGLNRILRYAGRPGGDYRPQAQYAYRTDAGLGLVELSVPARGELLALERGFVAGAGNTVRVYRVRTAGAADVTEVASLKELDRGFLRKELLFDVVDCPPSGAVAKQPQPNPLLDNIEGMAIGGRLPGGRRELYLISDDNGGATQITRVYRFAVSL